MIVLINETNPQKRFIKKAKEVLEEGGIVIFPTDTVYAYGCDINDKRAIERLYQIKKIPRNKPLSFIFFDISEISKFVRNVSDSAFKIMKKAFPGPYTFIFQASKLVPKIAITNQKTIGVRIPDNQIALELEHALGHPIMTASVSTKEGNYVIDPVDLDKEYRNAVDMILSCGAKTSEPSTVVDFTTGKAQIVRKGKGPLFFIEEE
ncbi:MAG TPA: L-threonylcarbamoyladenylate synthase [Spirochaetota bacterium]|nr:L-threonylcarbamoyladenylate synthase [Spirochaetota bacterium]HQI37237.1 L-threonylcarbamoyladenylate synthase [Spirochaetota bacterium]